MCFGSLRCCYGGLSFRLSTSSIRIKFQTLTVDNSNFHRDQQLHFYRLHNHRGKGLLVVELLPVLVMVMVWELWDSHIEAERNKIIKKGDSVTTDYRNTAIIMIVNNVKKLDWLHLGEYLYF